MALPLPGSPGSSWAVFKARLSNSFKGADPRVLAAFWLFGLINNVLYVIILSAALDLVGPSVPKGVVLLADVIPSFLTKLVAPYFIHSIPYGIRVVVFVAMSCLGMVLVALTPETRDGGSIAMKMVGVIIASASSGGGEASFLSLTHYYGHFSLAGWSSGTGGAGLIGAGAYVLATVTFALSVRSSLLTFSFLPFVMLASFFLVLPKEPMRNASKAQQGYEVVAEEDDDDDDDLANSGLLEVPANARPILSSTRRTTSPSSSQLLPARPQGIWQNFKANLRRSRGLFFPYMLPMLLVYIGEYTINQGVAPTLLFPLERSPFSSYRAFYPTYNAIYQSGVFISRSSTPFFRIHHLYFPSCLQLLNLVFLTLHALFDFIPSVWIIFLIIFWEGLLGGIVYVSTFAEITDNVPREEREFSLGATTVSDSGGVCIAGFFSMAMEVALCNWQVDHGRDYCRKAG